MAKRLQIFVSDISWDVLMDAQKRANDGFELGTVTIGDIVDQAIAQFELDATELQARKTDLKKVLKGFLKDENLSTENLIQKLSSLGNHARKVSKLKKVSSSLGMQDE